MARTKQTKEQKREEEKKRQARKVEIARRQEQTKTFMRRLFSAAGQAAPVFSSVGHITPTDLSSVPSAVPTTTEPFNQTEIQEILGFVTSQVQARTLRFPSELMCRLSGPLP